MGKFIPQGPNDDEEAEDQAGQQESPEGEQAEREEPSETTEPADEPPETSEGPEEGGRAPEPTQDTGDDLPQLQKVEREIMARVPGQLRSAVDRLVTAGMHVMFDPKTNQMLLQQVDKPGGAATDNVAQGIAALMSILKNQSKGPFPMQAVMPAAYMLMCQALDFMGKTGRMEVTDDEIADTFSALSAYMGQKMGVTAQTVQQARQMSGAGGPPAQPPQAAGAGLINNAAPPPQGA